MLDQMLLSIKLAQQYCGKIDIDFVINSIDFPIEPFF